MKPNCRKGDGDCKRRFNSNTGRMAQGEEAARLALILTEQARQESHGLE